VVDTLAIPASLAAGWGRLNDDQHYASQVLLGWYVAWEATGAVAQAGRPAADEQPAVTVAPLALPAGGGLRVTVRF
jgi:hypothetical protein